MTWAKVTWTSAFGRACGVLLDAIVRWLALARINPNVLTAMGLVVNTIAAFLFGYANGDNQARMFRYAGLVIIGSCRVGFMERPERLVLVIIGALFNRMAPVLWVIAVLSTITVIHRTEHTWRQTQVMETTEAGGKTGHAA